MPQTEGCIKCKEPGVEESLANSRNWQMTIYDQNAVTNRENE